MFVCKGCGSETRRNVSLQAVLHFSEKSKYMLVCLLFLFFSSFVLLCVVSLCFDAWRKVGNGEDEWRNGCCDLFSFISVFLS